MIPPAGRREKRAFPKGDQQNPKQQGHAGHL